MSAENTQVQKGDIVDLTSNGLEEINKYDNDYNDMRLLYHQLKEIGELKISPISGLV